MSDEKPIPGVRFGVYRPGNGLPEGYLGHLDGRWEYIENVVDFVGDAPVLFSGRYEARPGDNERAAVYLVWPPT